MLPGRIQTLGRQKRLHGFGGRWVQQQRRIGGNCNLRMGDAHVLELPGAVGLPERDGVHVFVDDAPGGPAVPGRRDRADAAAVHQHPVAPLLGPGNVHQVVLQAAGAGDVLNQATAAVEIELRLPHPAEEAQKVKGVDGPHAVAKPRLLGVAGEDIDGHVGIDGAHLLQNGLENAVVSGVALAVSAADQHAVPAALGPGSPAQQNPIDFPLTADRGVHREVLRGPAVEGLAQPVAQSVVLGHGCHMLGQLLKILGLKEEAADAVLN